MLYSKVLADKVLAADEADTINNPFAPFKYVNTVDDLPLTGNMLGTKVLVISNNTPYIWLGSGSSFGWYPLAMKSNAFALNNFVSTAIASNNFDYYVGRVANITQTATNANADEYAIHRLDDTGNHIWTTVLGCNSTNYSDQGIPTINRLYANDNYVYAYSNPRYVISGNVRNVAMITKLSRSTGSYEDLVALPVDLTSSPSNCIYSKQSVLGGITSVWTSSINSGTSLIVARYPDSLYQTGDTINVNSSHFYKKIALSTLPSGGNWRSAVELSDGSIVIAGSSFESSGSPNYYQWYTTIVIKISPDGNTVTNHFRGAGPTNSGASGFDMSMVSEGLQVLPDGNIFLGLLRNSDRDSGFIILDSNLNLVDGKMLSFSDPAIPTYYYYSDWTGVEYHIDGNYLYGYSIVWPGDTYAGHFISFILDLSTYEVVGTPYIWKDGDKSTYFNIINYSNGYIDYLFGDTNINTRLFHEKIQYPPNFVKWDYPSLTGRIDGAVNVGDIPATNWTITTTANPAGYSISNFTPLNIYSTHDTSYGGSSSYYDIVETNYTGFIPERIVRE